MDKTRSSGHVSVFPLQGSMEPLLAGRSLVALKMEKDEEIMARTMREQLKLTPRRANLAILTRVLIFCEHNEHTSAL